MPFEKVDVPEGSKGPWKITRFTVDSTDMHALLHGRRAPEKGEMHTKLTRNGTLVMSDTPAEYHDFCDFLWRAKGSVLIAGLGIGMVLKQVLAKPEVTDITVVEVSQDLIDLVGPHYQKAKLTLVCADIMTWKAPRDKRYDAVWLDIWDNICADNVPTMTTLKRRYARKAAYVGCWCEYQCRRAAREDRRYYVCGSMPA